MQFQRFASDHAKIGNEMRAARTTADNQHMASAAIQDVNHFVLVWSGAGSQSGAVDSDGVFARQFALAPPVIDLDANDSSGATSANFQTHYYDGGGPVALTDTDAVLMDTDDTQLASLTVTITNRQDFSAERLAADTSGTSLSAHFIPAFGTLTISGVASVADYEQVLRTITYDNWSGTATGVSRSITFVASDGAVSSNVATSSVLLNVPAGQLWLSTKGDGAATGEVWSNDQIITFGNSGDLFEPENGTTSGTLSELPGFAAGVDIRGLHYVQTDITLGTATQFALQPGDIITALNDTFTFNASDGDNGNDFSAGRKDLVVFRPDTAGNYSAGEWFMLLEEGVQRSGTSSNVHAISLVEADTAVGGTLLPRGTFLVAESGLPQHHNLTTFTINDTGFLATRNTTDAVELLQGDPLGNTGDQIQGVHLLRQTTDFGGTTLSAGTLLMQIKGTGTFAGVAHDEFDVMAVNVTQTEQDVISGSAATGTLLFDGSDLQLDDPLNESLTGLTVVTSTPQMSNQAPIATAGGPYTISEGSSLTIDAGGSSNPDGDPLTFAWDLDHDGNFGELGDPVTAGEGVSWSTLQSFGIDGDGSYTIGVQVNDGRGGLDTATTTVTVNNVAPTITSPAAVSVPENTVMVQSVAATDPVDPLTFAIVGGQDAARFSLNSTSGALSFLAAPDFEAPSDIGSDNRYEVVIEVSDGVQTDSQAIVVTIVDVNDTTPVIPAGQAFSVLETAANGTALGMVIASDTDAGTTFSNWTITGGNADGVFAINSTTGELTVVDRTSLDFETTQSYLLSVTVSDGSHTSAVQTVAITVGNTNDTAPVAVADNYSLNEGATLNRPKGSGVLANDFDVDGDVIMATLISGPDHADTFTFRADGSFRYKHDGSETGNDSFVYAVSDGTNSTTAIVNLAITSDNDGPTISPISGVTTPEDTATGPIAISVNDPDTPLNQLVLSATSGNQSLIPDSGLLLSGSGANRTLTITPAQDAFGGPVMILVSVSDGAITSSASFQVVVTPVNDAPVVSPAVVHQYTVTSNAAVSVASPGLLTGVSDVDSDALAIAVVSGPVYGSVVVRPDGSFTYEANAEFAGIDSFTFEVTDEDLSSSQKQVLLQVAEAAAPATNVLAPAQTIGQDTAPAAAAAPRESSAALQESLPPIVAAAAAPRETLSEDNEEISAAAVRQQQDDDSPVLFILSRDTTSVDSTEVSLSGQVISAAYTDRVEVSAFETLPEARTAQETGGDSNGNRNQPGAQAIETFSFERYAELKGTAEHVTAFSDNLKSEYALSDITTDSVVVVGSSVVIGTVVTALRTGMLALGLLSQLPVWTMFDPLMVIDGVTGEEDGDSLEDIVDRQTEKNEESEQTSQRN